MLNVMVNNYAELLALKDIILQNINIPPADFDKMVTTYDQNRKEYKQWINAQIKNTDLGSIDDLLNDI